MWPTHWEREGVTKQGLCMTGTVKRVKPCKQSFGFKAVHSLPKLQIMIMRGRKYHRYPFAGGLGVNFLGIGSARRSLSYDGVGEWTNITQLRITRRVFFYSGSLASWPSANRSNSNAKCRDFWPSSCAAIKLHGVMQRWWCSVYTDGWMRWESFLPSLHSKPL